MSDLEQVQAPALATLRDQAREFARNAKADSTRRAYRRDFQAFLSWCDQKGLEALPTLPRTLALYMTHLASLGRKVATIERALVSVSQAHKAAGLDSPRSTAPVQEVMRGIRRTLGVAQRQAAPALVPDLVKMLEALDQERQSAEDLAADKPRPWRKEISQGRAAEVALRVARDRAMLLLGFSAALRRSELVDLEVGDIQFTNEGFSVSVRRSKTDQEGQGRKIGVFYGSRAAVCPVRSLRAWLEAGGISDGPVFRAIDRRGHLVAGRLDDRAVALRVKRAAKLAGLDASAYSGHSLRAGLATAAAKAGKSERAIMKQTGHRSLPMVRRYIREGELFAEENATAGLL